MIQLIQTEHNLLGTPQDIENLKKIETPRILLISDSHGSGKAFRNIIMQYGRHCDALAFCGDGTADICALFNEAAINPELKESLPPVAAFVQGNGDPGFYPVNFGTKSLVIPARQTLNAGGVKIFICHGHREGVNFGYKQLEETARDAGCSVALYGHTHIPNIIKTRHVSIYNPGSIGIPRGGSSNSFVILTVNKKFTDANFIKIDKPLSDNPQFLSYQPIL